MTFFQEDCGTINKATEKALRKFQHEAVEVVYIPNDEHFTAWLHEGWSWNDGDDTYSKPFDTMQEMRRALKYVTRSNAPKGW